jgi:hypothetical protein
MVMKATQGEFQETTDGEYTLTLVSQMLFGFNPLVASRCLGVASRANSQHHSRDQTQTVQ